MKEAPEEVDDDNIEVGDKGEVNDNEDIIDSEISNDYIEIK